MKELSRRKFLVNAGQGIVATTMIPAFLQNDVDFALGLKSADTGLNDYLNRFGVTEALIREVLAEGLSRGGDFSEVYFQHRISNYIGLEDKQVNQAYTNIIYGVGIRVLNGDQTGYSYTEEITPATLKQAAQTAAAIANSNKKASPVKLSLYKHSENYPIQTSWETSNIGIKMPYLNRLNDQIFKQDNRIIKASAGISNETSYILIANSEGLITFDYQPLVTIFCSCTAEQNGKRENNGSNISKRLGMEFLTNNMIDRIAKEAVTGTVSLFEAIKPEAGEMEIVLGPGESGILLHEAMGHGFEADFNRIKTSIFSDKLNQKVAENFVTIVDNGMNQNYRGAINIDDEGNESKETVLVENGILKSYMHDRISAKHYGVEPTGNGRRDTFRNMPIPRMRNTYMKNGPHTPEEIIASVKKGIYAEKFTNGQVNIGAGDFTFYIKSGNLIENGKLGRPIKDVNIIGNGPKVLSNIVMVGNDMKNSEGAWTCGKNGQGAPVSMGIPTVKVSSITVGGINS